MALPAVPLAGAVLFLGVRRGWPPGRTVVRLAFVTYAALLGALVFFPLPLGVATYAAPLDIQLVPFRTISAAVAGGISSHVGRIGLGNVAAFVPMGLLVPLVLPNRPTIRTGFVAAIVASVAVEIGQLAISAAIRCGYRATDVDDVVLNSLGGLVGALAAAAILLVVGREVFGRPNA